jgi:tetratricopeptide (TPR) repeat protein
MLGLEPGFEAAIDKRFAALRKVLAPPPSAPKGDSSLDTLKRLAAEYPDSYVIQAGLGHVLQESEDIDGAVVAFERATALVPMAKGPASPRVFLIDLLEHKGDKARMMHHLEALLEYDQADVGAARRLAALATAAGDERRAWLAYERITGLDPFDAAAHAVFGRMALKRGDAQTAVRELKAALGAGSIDASAGYCDLGEAYLMAGRPADAKRQAIQALEIAPGYARAQELLLKTVEPRP